MSPELAIALSVALFLGLILIEMQIAVAIAITGTLGLVLVQGPEIAARAAATIPYTATSKYALFVIPMYVLLGCLIANAGIGTRIYSAVNRLVHRLPGGLAASAVIATSVFSGISGSSAADVATFGRMSVTEMSRHGYAKTYAAAVVAAAGTFAVLIPPSITVVIYAFVAGESAGEMILAGVIPGILSAVLLTGFVLWRAAISRGQTTFGGGPAAVEPELALVGAGGPTTISAMSERHAGGGSGGQSPDSSGTSSGEPSASTSGGSLFHDLTSLFYAALLFAVVVGGLYTGFFTAIEAAAVGAFLALILSIVIVRAQPRKVATLIGDSLAETVSSTSMIFMLIVGGAMFSASLAYSQVPHKVVEWASGLPVPPTVVVLMLLLVLLPLGAILDGLSLLLLTVPIMAPVATGLGFDGVWFGILVIKMIEIGLITPPVGTNAFIISGVTGIPAEKVFKSLIPFVLLDIAFTGVMFAFPEIILWLPHLAAGGA